MTKGELMTLVYGESYSGVDSALPQQWLNTVAELLPRYGLKFEYGMHCMNYNAIRQGEIVNLAEELVRSGKLKELLDELEQLRYAKENSYDPG